jgi:DNA topoisomerase I
MSKNLVIVESPAKARTIEKYLGKDFEVLASYGHVRDLVPKEGAVDPEHGFAMKYQLIEKNEKHVEKIAKAVKHASAVYLATDPDREGEAISWHVYEVLKDRNLIDSKPVHRVVFHEVTKRAIQEAIAHPRGLSAELINAQQARRALDYLVGFNLSPLLWKKVRRGLSAGRVQSPALRMIVERDDEIAAFVPQEYWSIEAAVQHTAQGFKARLATFRGTKVEQFTFTNEAATRDAERAIHDRAAGVLTVANIEKKQRRRNPAAPFTTSTLQQEASRKLGFSAQKTMTLAQRLYEGIDIGEGSVGLITYMRTDSVTLANDALTELRDVIVSRYGKENLPEEPRRYTTKARNAQEAHEAVRPTSAANAPEDVKRFLDHDQFRLYELIWKRTVACQMNPAVYDTVGVDLAAGASAESDILFRATGSVLVSPGFIAVYQEGLDDTVQEEQDSVLPAVAEGDRLTLAELLTEQHFTEPPPRFSEATLVKALEEYGIGRPSTYASIISTLRNREYVEMESRRFVPTDVGRVVNRFLTEYFSQYVDYEFTARMEDSLDAVSRGEREWVPLLAEFWQPFQQLVEYTETSVTREQASQARVLGNDPKSGRPISVRMGRYGAFVQIGTKDDEEKPKFAGLRPGQKMDYITLDEALDLFKLPRELGETPDGEAVSANIGRFGPYVRYSNKFVSIRDEDDPYTITLERALELIEEKKQADANRIISAFDGSEVQVLNGRFGPYVTNGSKNAKIPKDKEPAKLTLEECEALLAAAPERRGRNKKAGTKKAAGKGVTSGGDEAAEKAATGRKTRKKAAKKTPAKKAKKKTKKKAGTKKSKSRKKAGKKAAKDTAGDAKAPPGEERMDSDTPRGG